MSHNFLSHMTVALHFTICHLQTKFHKTIVFVTHDIDEAIKLADRIAIMQAGKLIQVNVPEQILRHPINDFVRTFIGADRINQIEKYPAIEEVMVRAITSSPSFGLAEGLIKMRKYKVDSLFIVAKDKTFLGVVDIHEIQKNFSDEKILLSNIMNRDVYTIKVSQELKDAINLISNHHIEFVPVLDDNHHLKGLITRISLLDVMSDQVQGNNNNTINREGD